MNISNLNFIVDFFGLKYVGLLASACPPRFHEPSAITIDAIVTARRHPLPEPFGTSSLWEVLLLHSVQCVPRGNTVWDRLLLYSWIQRTQKLQKLFGEQCCHSFWKQAAPCGRILHHIRCPSVGPFLNSQFLSYWHTKTFMASISEFQV